MTSDQPIPTIALIHEQAPARIFLTDNLTADGYEVLEYTSAESAWGGLAGRYPDAILLDYRLRERGALVLLEHLRDPGRAGGRVEARVPIIVLEAREALERIRALEAGADDATPHPLGYPELRARLAALLRARATPENRNAPLRVGGLQIDPGPREVRLDGTRIDLAAKEFALLKVLAADPTHVFTKSELLRGIWGIKQPGSTRTLDSHACRLRSKLTTPARSWIVNVWGVGYRLCDAVPA